MTGDVIGDYVLDGEPARARTAWTYTGTHARLGRAVAVRVMAPGPRVRGAHALFLREAWVLDRMRHPGVARVYDCGTLADGRGWFAMDPVAGPSLAEVIASGARVDPLRVLVELSTVLGHAHALGLAHRQLRADAITCGYDPRGPALRVDDWTCARELALHPSDAAADVHALGLVALQCLSGVMAFSSGALAWQATSTVADRFPRASRLLTAIVDRMLARDPRACPSMAAVREMATALVPPAQPRDARGGAIAAALAG